MKFYTPMVVNKNEWLQIEPPSTAPAGVLDAARWRELNVLMSMTGNLSHDDIIRLFCREHRISRQTVEGALATFRHFGPDSWQ
jgi:hypothetical protein